MGILRPWGNTGDVDNFSKTILDMVQPNEKRGHIGIMENDCLVYEMNSRKFYSINPRYELRITYMDKVPDQILKLLRLKGADDI
jgi:Holliday junction resolvase RusA-like endonuclease